MISNSGGPRESDDEACTNDSEDMDWNELSYEMEYEDYPDPPAHRLPPGDMIANAAPTRQQSDSSTGSSATLSHCQPTSAQLAYTYGMPVAFPQTSHQPFVNRTQRFSALPLNSAWSDSTGTYLPSFLHKVDANFLRRRSRSSAGDFEDEDIDNTLAGNSENGIYGQSGLGPGTTLDGNPEEAYYDSSFPKLLEAGKSLLVNGGHGHSPKGQNGVDMRAMDYRTRRRYQRAFKIELNVTSLDNRRHFLLRLARAFMTFGAPSHRVDSQLIAASELLDVKAEYIHFPGVLICSFKDHDELVSGGQDVNFVRAAGSLNLGMLHTVHEVYRSVMHDEISAKVASLRLEELLNEPPPYAWWLKCVFAFWMSVLICPLAFGGSFTDMWFSGLFAVILAFFQTKFTHKSTLYANVFEITMSVLVSFLSRALDSIKHDLFCYTAISSSSIISILPGYLILNSSLELASKNIVCGSVKMVYALVYTLFLGFGLQIGSDFYLLINRPYQRRLAAFELAVKPSVSFAGSWVAENGADHNTLPFNATWTFTPHPAISPNLVIAGCYRPSHSPWYLQAFPIWTTFFIVPIYSLISSLANQQPLVSKELPIMVFISCAGYAVNSVANHYIFARSDVVSSLGAFTIGLLGNLYSRKMGGTALTSMVTGVLFLVPSGLSSAGGITARGDGIAVGQAMVSVTIGITVGVFMSHSLVYTFGPRKKTAGFSF